MELDRIICGDCLEELPAIPEDSIDAIVTDPPYELAFMGRKWDASGIAYNKDMWAGCLRVLKPGGHLLAFGGTRTYHRMVCAIEDAGFEIRDSIEWVYGSGFPKSLDISKAIDKMAGVEREIIGISKMGAHNNGSGAAPSDNRTDAGKGVFGEGHETFTITAPATEEAKQWAGYGTALKPAHEPIVLARKPLEEPTIAANVLAWGTGGLNIDGCRISINPESENPNDYGRICHNSKDRGSVGNFGINKNVQDSELYKTNGRFPANLIHDGSPEVLAEFAKAGESKSPKTYTRKSSSSSQEIYQRRIGEPEGKESLNYGDSGSPARFFQSCPFTDEDYSPFRYVAKASRSERERGLDGLPLRPLAEREGRDNCMNSKKDLRYENRDAAITSPAKNFHPTVKPLSLMRYLCRLITPPGGLILDPFTGSGTTCVAAKEEGFHFIGIEKESEYREIARKRVAAAPSRLNRWFSGQEAEP